MMFSKAVLPNAEFPIETNDFGNSTLFSAVQPLKASTPMLVNVDGNSIVSKLVQL